VEAIPAAEVVAMEEAAEPTEAAEEVMEVGAVAEAVPAAEAEVILVVVMAAAGPELEVMLVEVMAVEAMAAAEVRGILAGVEVMEEAADFTALAEGTVVGQAAANLLARAVGMATRAQPCIPATATRVGETTTTHPRFGDGARIGVMPVLTSTIKWSAITIIIPTHRLITPQAMS